ncbi:unnamed protein product [Ectocarpus sp. CCAP 1310/34]|nr:unnamed protein product [Ectocarpus sp. CCAP 1310/34]
MYVCIYLQLSEGKQNNNSGDMVRTAWRRSSSNEPDIANAVRAKQKRRSTETSGIDVPQITIG